MVSFQNFKQSKSRSFESWFVDEKAYSQKASKLPLKLQKKDGRFIRLLFA